MVEDKSQQHTTTTNKIDTMEIASLILVTLSMCAHIVVSTNNVKMEKMMDTSGKTRIMDLDNTWPLSDDFKAILGIVTIYLYSVIFSPRLKTNFCT